ncbi:molybdate ABC transporter substrate-binding protein [Mycobacterium sp. ITM-2017-0098]|nr:molybdate ABC transporter substrate-binding protein [Mycobacterium sp. ITM-2017-0098]
MRPIAGFALCVALLVAGCSSAQDDSGADGVTVFAAASLKSTFTELGAQFESDHPGSKVTFNFAGSSDLVAQLGQGAPADVFAPADTDSMTKAVDAGLVSGTPVDFAANTLTIVTPPGNPEGIMSFADLARPGTQVVVCAPQVPCGSAAQKVEKAAGVTLTPVSEESAVTDVLGKITSGQADAGLVYATDAAAAGDKVTAVPFPESAGAVNTYPIASLSAAPNPTAARQFIDLVTGPRGQDVLSAAGFVAP